jgi:hypothetical protein
MNLYQIQPGDEKERVFAAFTVADLKRLYNALAIDQATNEQPDQGTADLLNRLEQLISSQ